MGGVSVSHTVLYNLYHPVSSMNKIIPNKIVAKGDFVQMCVCLSPMCLYPYVCLPVCTYIYYITALHAYGSDAVNQHNDGDGIKTRRGIKLEEGTEIGQGREGRC